MCLKAFPYFLRGVTLFSRGVTFLFCFKRLAIFKALLYFDKRFLKVKSAIFESVCLEASLHKPLRIKTRLNDKETAQNTQALV